MTSRSRSKSSLPKDRAEGHVAEDIERQPPTRGRHLAMYADRVAVGEGVEVAAHPVDLARNAGGVCAEPCL